MNNDKNHITPAQAAILQLSKDMLSFFSIIAFGAAVCAFALGLR